MPERPTDPMISRVGIAAGCEADMHECAREAGEIDKRRRGIRDPESRELAKHISTLLHRQASIYHLLSIALLPAKVPQKQKRPLGLWGHFRAWVREWRG
jgi:hypothetical protein